MNLVKKIKDILFEEETDDNVEVVKINDDVKSTPDTIKVEPEKEPTEPVKEEIPSERELFKVDNNTFKFPDFDEEEFQSSLGRSNNTASDVNRDSYRSERPNNNVLEFERKKNVEKRNEYTKYERSDREIDGKDKKKFKPSPIISPVYGILNKDYKTSDIIDKTDTKNIDVDYVRRKAFESLPKEEKVEKKIDIKEENETISEPVVTFFEERDEVASNKNTDNDFKTIDALLEEASDEITLEDTLEMPTSNNLDAIEEELEKIDEEEKQKDFDDTLNEKVNDNLDDSNSTSGDKDEDLDSDLFELIDSMYDERKED